MEEQTLLQDLMELATHMRQERLFTQYEINNLQTLNEQVYEYFIIIKYNTFRPRFSSQSFKKISKDYSNIRLEVH